ncbi:MAG: cell wall hydrolase [Alphaproteobacteria bacterium]|nr:cell wall hydrolase [Alphaproteobacteria bacterium]
MIELLIFGLVVTGGVLLFPKSVGATLPPVSDILQPAQISNVDLDTLARTIWGEARGEGYSGMQAVANVIMNRYEQAQASVAKARQFGGTVSEICRKPYQFSAWNITDPNFSKMQAVRTADAQFRQALDIAEKALRGTLSDITGGADHYHTAAVDPSWSRGVEPVAVINSHQFYRLA